MVFLYILLVFSGKLLVCDGFSFELLACGVFLCILLVCDGFFMHIVSFKFIFMSFAGMLFNVIINVIIFLVWKGVMGMFEGWVKMWVLRVFFLKSKSVQSKKCPRWLYFTLLLLLLQRLAIPNPKTYDEKTQELTNCSKHHENGSSKKK